MELFFDIETVLMQNWIIWYGTVFDIESVYLCLTELFEIGLFVCIKIDLAFIAYNGWFTIKP